MSAGRTPRRTCVGCRRIASSTELVRLHRGPDGTLAVGRGPGRGAWLCGQPDTLTCFDEAAQRRALDRALRASVGRDELAALRAKLEDMSG